MKHFLRETSLKVKIINEKNKICDKIPPEIQYKTAKKLKIRKFHDKKSPENQFKSEYNKRNKNKNCKISSGKTV